MEEEDDGEAEEEELEMFDESIDRFEHSRWRPRRLCLHFMAGRFGAGWACTFADGEQELHPSTLRGWSRTWTCQCRRSRLSSRRRSRAAGGSADATDPRNIVAVAMLTRPLFRGNVEVTALSMLPVPQFRN